MRLDIVMTDVVIDFYRNRRLTRKTINRVILKGNTPEEIRKNLNIKRLGKDFDPKRDKIVEIIVVKKVGDTSVID